jgi:hypothetical protein
MATGTQSVISLNKSTFDNNPDNNPDELPNPTRKNTLMKLREIFKTNYLSENNRYPNMMCYIPLKPDGSVFNSEDLALQYNFTKTRMELTITMLFKNSDQIKMKLFNTDLTNPNHKKYQNLHYNLISYIESMISLETFYEIQLKKNQKL